MNEANSLFVSDNVSFQPFHHFFFFALFLILFVLHCELAVSACNNQSHHAGEVWLVLQSLNCFSSYPNS